MTNGHDHTREHLNNSLVTEKDIDPRFGLFTEEVQEGAVSETSEEISEELATVPDADIIAKDSPVDAATPVEEFHGTDLLNGVGRHPEEETEER
jgi:hypothetical protein